MIVLRADDRGVLPSNDAVRVHIAAFEASDKGYWKLPLHTAYEDDAGEYATDGDYEEGTDEQLDIDAEFDHTDHTNFSACVTTEHPCFADEFSEGSSMIKTYMRLQVLAAGDHGNVPVALVQLEDEFAFRVELPKASAHARYRLIVSLTYRGYVRLLSPAQAARIFNLEPDMMNVQGDGSKQVVCV